MLQAQQAIQGSYEKQSQFVMAAPRPLIIASTFIKPSPFCVSFTWQSVDLHYIPVANYAKLRL